MPVSSHIVLFYLRGGGRRGPSLVERFRLKVSGRGIGAGTVDGAKHFKHLLEDAKKYEVEEILVKVE